MVAFVTIRASQSVQHSVFRRVDVIRMNLERSPVVDGIVLRRYRGDDAHLRMLAEQITTDTWPSVRLVKGGDDHETWQGTFRMRVYTERVA